MSIATELQDLNDNILDAYTAIGNKGGTVPAQKNTANLDTAIGSIPAAPEAYIPLEVENNTLRKSGEISTWVAPNTATTIGDHGLYYAFYSYSNLISVDLNNITSIGNQGLNSAFYNCTDLTTVNLNNVTTINNNGLQNAFQSCTSLTSVDLSNVTSIGDNGLNSAFKYCSKLTTIDLSKVTTVSANGLYSAFQGCTRLTSVDLSSLTTASSYSLYYAFGYCSNLTTISFPALTTSSFGNYDNQFNNMLSGCSNVTVHFPAAIQSKIGSWGSVTSGFGGTNTTVLFDL